MKTDLRQFSVAEVVRFGKVVRDTHGISQTGDRCTGIL
jgi:hypothetical protein